MAYNQYQGQQAPNPYEQYQGNPYEQAPGAENGYGQVSCARTGLANCDGRGQTG